VRIPATHLLAAVLFALPAVLVTNETFQPVDTRITLEGATATQVLRLARSQPLFLEYGLTLRAPGAARPTAVIDLNGTTVTRVPAERLYVPVSGKVLAPARAAREGANELRVQIEGAVDATFELNGRLQNYYGIAPDFPRVFVVPDAAVRHLFATEPVVRTAIRSAACIALGLMLAWLAGRGGPAGVRRWLLFSSPSWLVWLLLGYGLATPLHVWLSVEALVVGALGGWAIARAGTWLLDHRRRAARMAAVVAVNVLVLEVALRGFNAVRPSFVFYSSGYERYRGQPGARFYDTTLNSGGFNDLEHERTRPPGVTRRIVAIGDSFALGVVPYRENYLTRLESELSPGGRVEVINIGIPATGPADYLAMLVKEGLPYGPDLVIANVFVGNDFEVPGRRWHEHSFVATFLRALWRLRGGTPPAPAARDGALVEYRDDEPSLSRERFLEIEVGRSWVYVRSDRAMIDAVDRVRADLRGMRDVAARAGAGFLVVLLPDEVQVDERLRAEVTLASGYAASDLDFERPNRLLREQLAADGTRVVDLLPAFQNAARTSRLYKPRDTHWNIAGNQLAAREIAAAVRATVTARP
jgi:lysophospholipase L1-like esterase